MKSCSAWELGLTHEMLISFEFVTETDLNYVIFQKRVRVFHRGFKHDKTDESKMPWAECFYCFRVFEAPMNHEARVFEITSPTKENYHLNKFPQFNYYI